MRHSIVNLGCKVNRVESDSFERLLQGAGSHPAGEADADLIVINTCTVTGDAEKKTRKAVRHALRENPAAPVLVTGCAAAISPGAFTAMDERVTIVPKHEMESFLDAYVVDWTKLREGDVHPLSSRQRVGVKLQDGCDNACTYCIVHVARGPARSREEEAVIADVMRLAREGIREIVLTGINLGAYGREDRGRSLALLMQRLLEATASVVDDAGRCCRFRLSSIEPTDLTEDILETMVEADGRICRHLHLPLQAGSTKVLAEMARPYTAEDYMLLVDTVRDRIPQVALATDIIVGFPGEREADFAQTMSLCEACAFSSMHVFPYSRREGTPAAARTDQIPGEVKAERAARLRGLAGELREADRRRRKGSTELVLVERTGHGMTESYHEVAISSDALPGSLVPYRFA